MVRVAKTLQRDWHSSDISAVASLRLCFHTCLYNSKLLCSNSVCMLYFFIIKQTWDRPTQRRTDRRKDTPSHSDPRTPQKLCQDGTGYSRLGMNRWNCDQFSVAERNSSHQNAAFNLLWKTDTAQYSDSLYLRHQLHTSQLQDMHYECFLTIWIIFTGFHCLWGDWKRAKEGKFGGKIDKKKKETEVLKKKKKERERGYLGKNLAGEENESPTSTYLEAGMSWGTAIPIKSVHPRPELYWKWCEWHSRASYLVS